jgi:hypothetical protein
MNSSLLKPSKMNKARLNDFNSRCEYYQNVKKDKLEKVRLHKDRSMELDIKMFENRKTVHSKLEEQLNSQSLSASKSTFYNNNILVTHNVSSRLFNHAKIIKEKLLKKKQDQKE